MIHKSADGRKACFRRAAADDETPKWIGEGDR
jgi:hypothetical protein